MWEDVQGAIQRVLDSTTIGQLAARDRSVSAAGGRYVI
jgi:hypothetical protein